MNGRCFGVLICAALVAGWGISPAGSYAAITGYWEEQNSTVEKELYGLSFADEDEGWVVGADGVILHTRNGGETWIQQESGTVCDLHSVAFVTPKDGWVVGFNTLLRTTDAGETWTDIFSSEWKLGDRAMWFWDIALLDPTSGWIGDRGGYVAYLTYDDPSSSYWRELTEITVQDVDFLSADMGWCVGSHEEWGVIYRITGGGAYWTYTWFETPVRAVHFVDDGEGWAVGDQGAIFHSVDGGESWERQESGTDYTDLRDVFFVDGQGGWAVGKSGLILKTLTGGKTWHRLIWTGEYEGFHPRLNRVVFVDPLEGWIVGERGTILHFVGEYETIPGFTGTTDEEPALEVRRGRVVLGRGGHPWKICGTRSNLEIEGDVLRPARLDPRENLVRRIQSDGEIWSSVPAPLGTSVTAVIDNDPERTTSYRVPDLKSSATVYLDFGELYPLHRVEITLSSQHASADPLLSQRVTVGTNDGDPKDVEPRGAPFLHPVWDEVIRGQPDLSAEFPPRFARYLGIRISESPFVRIFDVRAFAEGYFGRSTFVSRPIDFGALSVWGKLRWEGERPPGTNVILRTRTGDDDDPDVYWYRIGESENYTNLTESGEPLTRYEYEALPGYERGGITFDAEHWTRWSARYPFEEGEAPIQSPDARRYLQIEVAFDNAADAAGTLSSLSVEASNPASAYLVLGEIVPAHTRPARMTTFTYGIRPRFREGDIGFDTAEIRTPVRPTSIRSVLIDSAEVAFTSEIRDDPPGFVVQFPELMFPLDNPAVAISFDCEVFRYGTGFPGYVSNSRYEEGFPQRVVAGDALEGMGEDVLTVQTELETPLLLQPNADPNPFTPNGDGINDETELSYTVLKLFASAPVRVKVYDLAGRLVRDVYQGTETDGMHAHRWDGRDEEGQAVSPGVYVYRVELNADADRQAVLGVVHVVY